MKLEETGHACHQYSLGKTHSPSSSDHYSRLNFVLFCEIEKSGVWTKRAKIVITTGHGLWVGLVDNTVMATSNV